ncbi:MAG: hypothetical protein JWN52_4656 [Actinomycetia bacterium]|nr:hypothetical protein [Actinomycetes bacterium]
MMIEGVVEVEGGFEAAGEDAEADADENSVCVDVAAEVEAAVEGTVDVEGAGEVAGKVEVEAEAAGKVAAEAEVEVAVCSARVQERVMSACRTERAASGSVGGAGNHLLVETGTSWSATAEKCRWVLTALGYWCPLPMGRGIAIEPEASGDFCQRT